MKRVHFSDLKAMALSPAHYLARVDVPMDPTRSMRIGTIVHHLVLGPQPGKALVRYDGDRRGKAWESFRDANAHAEIVTASEWSEAEPIARAVATNDVAQELLSGCVREKPLEWEYDGLPCATRGIDALGCARVIDLKTTTSTQPTKWARQCFQMHYPAQLAWYELGAQANGIDTSGGLYLIGVECEAPYAVTCFRLTEPVVELGRKQLGVWTERLKASLGADAWPAYTQSVLDLELPVWMQESDDDA